MTRGPMLFLAAPLLLLGAAMLPGCANDPGAAPGAEAQSHRPAPAPGGFTVHMGGMVAAEAAVAR